MRLTHGRRNRRRRPADTSANYQRDDRRHRRLDMTPGALTKWSAEALCSATRRDGQRTIERKAAGRMAASSPQPSTPSESACVAAASRRALTSRSISGPPYSPARLHSVRGADCDDVAYDRSRNSLPPGIFCFPPVAPTKVGRSSLLPDSKRALFMTSIRSRASVVRADGRLVQPTVRSVSRTSATKTERLRAARVEKTIGQATTSHQKRAAAPRAAAAVRVTKLKQQKRIS